MKGVFKKLPALWSAAAAAMLAALLLLEVVGQHWLSFSYQSASLLSNGALYPAALLGMGLLFFWRSREKGQASEALWPVRLLFVALLAAQFVVARTCWFHMAWDPGDVHACAEALARGQDIGPHVEYFSVCPNNAPLAVLLSVPLWFAVKLGLGVPYVVLPYINAVILNATCYLTYACVRHLTRSQVARRFALVLCVGWLGLSPYVLYPYTDMYALLFPILSLYLYLRCQRPVLKWFLISLGLFIGASFKPTILIFLIALLALSVCQALSSGASWRAMLKRSAAVVAVVVLGMVPGKVWQDEATRLITGSAKPEEQINMTHYLMLGMNDDTYGGVTPVDVAFSRSFATLEERQQANLQRAWERVANRGVLGNLRFFTIKAYKAYGDGSFAATYSVLPQEIPPRDSAVSRFLRSLYYNDGARMPYAQTLAQCLWLGVITLCAYTAFRWRRQPVVALLALTLLGVTVYLLLFEVWPRYLFVFAPFFVVLAALAFQQPLKKREND